MKTDLRDWVAAASGRVYSVATVEAGERIGTRRRVAIRLMVHRGVVPDIQPERDYAAALARDLDRMRPRGFNEQGHWLRFIAFTLLFVSAALDSNWPFAAVCVCFGALAAISAVVHRSDKRTLRAVVIAGYGLMTDAERSAFNHSVREPLPLGIKQLTAGSLALAIPVLALAMLVAFLVQVDNTNPPDWTFAASLGVIFTAIMVGSSLITRRRFLKELRGEARPIEPPVPVESLQAEPN